MSTPILVSFDAGVQTITLNRPDKLNSFNPEMHTQLRSALDEAAANPAIRCVLLTGAGRGFCAGQDLSERDMKDPAVSMDLGATIEKYYNPLVKFMQFAPSMVSRPAPAQTLRWPATSSSPQGPPPFFRPSQKSGWSPTRAAPISCRASRARRAQWPWRCSRKNCLPSMPSAWASSGGPSTTTS